MIFATATKAQRTVDALVGKRTGQHSIRVTDQWRLCFVWREGDAFDIEIVDYHGE